MRRGRRSSSDSYSSDEKSSSKYNRHRRHRSSSNSSIERSKRNNRNKKYSASKRNRKHRSESSRSSSSSSSTSRSSDRYSKSTKRNRHRSSSSPETKSRLIDLNMEREKNFEFNDALNKLYKNDQSRRNQITKIEDDGGGFKPKSFKSSRSTQKTTDNKTKITKEQEHDNAMFGPVTSITNETNLLNPTVEFSVVSSNVKSLMHESLFEDIAEKEKRWKLKLLDMIKTN